MANEVYTSLTTRAKKNGATVEFSGNYNLDMTGDELLNATQVIGTSSEALDFGDITGAPGQVIVKNLDSTNFIEIGGNSGLTVFKLTLRAGEFASFTPGAATVYAKADTAAARIQIIATEA
jgi:hypothetical protein